MVELLIVVIITSVIATIAIPKFADSSIRAKEARLKLYLKMLRSSTERFHADTGLWPVSTDLINGTTPTQGYTDQGLLVAMPPGVYNGPYLDKNGTVVGISGVTLIYSLGGAYPVGNWRLTGLNGASDGTSFSSW